MEYACKSDRSSEIIHFSRMCSTADFATEGRKQSLGGGRLSAEVTTIAEKTEFWVLVASLWGVMVKGS